MLSESQISEVIKYFNKYCLARISPPYSDPAKELIGKEQDKTNIENIIDSAEQNDYENEYYGEELHSLLVLMCTLNNKYDDLLNSLRRE